MNDEGINGLTAYVVLRPFNGLDIGNKIYPTAFHADYLMHRGLIKKYVHRGLIKKYVGEPMESPVNRMMQPTKRRGRPKKPTQ